MPRGVYVRTEECNEAHKSPLRLCEIEGCNEKHHANGLCQKHNKKQYNQVHKEQIAKRTKQYAQSHKESIARYQRQWEREWSQTPRGKATIKAKAHNRRTLLKGLTLAIVQRVYEDNIKKFGRLTCVLCFKPIEFGKDSLDHLTPLSRQGTNDFSNLGVAHGICNSKKGTMTLQEWFLK